MRRDRRRRARRWLLPLALVCLASSGCKNLYRFPSAEQATATSDGRLWLAGSEGFAASLLGSTALRNDYANSELLAEPFYRARLGAFPSAQVVELGAEIELVTRAADRYRYTGQRWKRLPLDLGGSGALRGQVNFAASHEGKLLLYVNDGRLLWVDPANGQRVREEPLYGHVYPMAVHNNSLVGIGYRGTARTLVRRRGETQWQELVRFAAEDLQVLALARLADQWVVVLDRGLVMVADDGTTRFIRGDALQPDALPLGPAGALPEGSPFTAAKLAEAPQTFGVALGAPGVIVLPRTNRLVVLSVAATKSATATAGNSSGEGEGDTIPTENQPSLQLSTVRRCAGLNERPFPMPVYGPVAQLRDGRIVMSSASGKLYGLAEGQCTQLSPALIDW